MYFSLRRSVRMVVVPTPTTIMVVALYNSEDGVTGGERIC